MRPSNPQTPQRYQIPVNLLQPLWLRSRESLVDNGLVYDPIAARACTRCHLAAECFSGDIDQKQLLHVTLTQLCDRQVHQFLDIYPDGWIVNVGAGLDTRFYRIDNGRCHWIELDVTENLLWRQKLFHRSERYQHLCGSVSELGWLEQLPIPENAPVLIVCEHALLDCDEEVTARFIRTIGLNFSAASACIVLAGDKTHTQLGQKMGSGNYAHGFSSAQHAVMNCLPWVRQTRVFSPLDSNCGRWKLWHKWLSKLSGYKQRVTPVVVHIQW